ncbi:hypothetical protein [Ramlibacter tataouinensis]|uniref:hypothetical protein n=1 Tax=Ramlibacter tataouinensis TaxID=94132 RepID=UPI0011AE6EAB|nr:hypothetical protein [Ramlibacter tataouinensis]
MKFVLGLSKHTNSKFFLLRPSLTWDSDALPVTTWRVQELVSCGTRLGTRSDTDDARSINIQIEKAINQRLSNRAALDIPSPLSDLLGNVPCADLRRLFLTRCFMNFSGFKLTDLDGVCEFPAGLAVVEFKRKDMTSGNDAWEHIRISKNQSIIKQYKKLWEKLPQEANSRDDVRNAFRSDSDWRRLPGRGIGLDGSHLTTVRLCNEAGIKYHYVVWLHGKTQPQDLLDEHLQARHAQTLLLLTVNGDDDFDRTTFTNADDSGAWDKNVRYQLVIPEGRFERLELPLFPESAGT